jgi:ribose transport system substrate-binding protein
MIARCAARPARVARLVSAPLIVGMLLAGIARGGEAPQGLTRPVRLKPFDPAAPACSAPPGLARTLAFAQDNLRDFMMGVRRGLELAGKDRGLAFEVRVAENDASAEAANLAAFLHAKSGAVVVAPVDATALAPVMRRVIGSGAYLGTVVPPPAITILNAPQYLTGKVLGDAATAYIRNHLNGNAKVVLLTHDSLEFLAPRFAAMREALRDLPGATIVADISPLTVDRAGGRTMMETIMLANPDIDVVLGADTVVLGALDAVRAAGRSRPDQFFGGIDGEPDAVAELTIPGSPYKTSVSLASPIFGYALGHYAADWLDGKSVPQAMDILPVALTGKNLARYEADSRDPAAVFNDPARRDAYLRLYGNICYDTRTSFIDFPWSSEN